MSSLVCIDNHALLTSFAFERMKTTKFLPWHDEHKLGKQTNHHSSMKNCNKRKILIHSYNATTAQPWKFIPANNIDSASSSSSELVSWISLIGVEVCFRTVYLGVFERNIRRNQNTTSTNKLTWIGKIQITQILHIDSLTIIMIINVHNGKLSKNNIELKSFPFVYNALINLKYLLRYK